MGLGLKATVPLGFWSFWSILVRLQSRLKVCEESRNLEGFGGSPGVTVGTQSSSDDRKGHQYIELVYQKIHRQPTNQPSLGLPLLPPPSLGLPLPPPPSLGLPLPPSCRSVRRAIPNVQFFHRWMVPSKVKAGSFFVGRYGPWASHARFCRMLWCIGQPGSVFKKWYTP